jgi:hypothetical protein
MDDLFACDDGGEEMEGGMDMDGVGGTIGLPEDEEGDILAKRSLMLDACAGATG